MIDLHCHILPNVDDGPEDIEASVVMAKKAIEQGITHVLCTPHHNNGRYHNSKATVITAVALLQEELTRRHCNQTLLELQSKFPELSICKSGPERIEITPANITKGKAIELIKQDQPFKVTVVGDSENDVSMFETADKSFCLRHASPEVRDVADHVIDDFYEVVEYL